MNVIESIGVLYIGMLVAILRFGSVGYPGEVEPVLDAIFRAFGL